MSPDESVTTGTDLVLTVTDASGHRWSSPVSQLNRWGVDRMPASTSTTLGKIVLQQVHVPTSALRKAGLDLHRVASVGFAPAVGADGSASGGAYLSDLGFDTRAMGTPHARQRPAVNVASTAVEEGSGLATDRVAVYLSRPSGTPVSAWFTVLGSATGTLAPSMAQVTFPPGTTCRAVPVPITGDTLPGTAPTTSYKIAVSNSGGAVLGDHDFGTVTVREDDGVTPPQGDVCAGHRP